MDKLDFKKLYKTYYSPKSDKPEIISMPRMQFLMVDGRGDPNNSADFQAAFGLLYGTAYTMKFSRKKTGKTDFSIGALEGLWWNEKGEAFGMDRKDDWYWTLMLWVPDDITQDEFETARGALKARKPELTTERIRLGTYKEGVVVQIMHIGPYDTEQSDVEKMHSFASAEGYTQSGKHHEIYFGDPRRTVPEKLRTILRHPLERVE